jgi:hypothetical protein
MNKLKYISLLLLLITIIFIYIYFYNNNNLYREAFIPKVVKETYRPIVRNMRMTYEGFYNQSSTDISNLFRKFGLI